MLTVLTRNGRYYRDLVLLQEGGMFQDMERMDVSWKMCLEGSLPGLLLIDFFPNFYLIDFLSN